MDKSKMVQIATRGFRKNWNPSHYNLRFKPSQGSGYVFWHQNNTIHGPEHDSAQSNRDPTKFKYSNNIFRNDYMEWRMRAADYLYQISTRLHRSNDAWTKFLVAWTSFSWMMFA